MSTPTVHRQTPQRTAVAEALRGAAGFQTAQQVFERLADAGARVSLATVYRHLQALAETGDADVLRTPDGQTAYRCCAGHAHHHHLVCRDCGRTVEIQLGSFEDLVAALAREHGFTQVDHEIELFGRCSSCAPLGQP